MASNAYSWSLLGSIKQLLSINISKDIFDAVNKNIVGSLHAKNMRFIIPNRVSMDDLEVLDEDGQRVLYGKHVELTVSLISLLTNNIVISDALVESPFFRYTIYNNVHNIIRMFEGRPGADIEPPDEKKSKLRVTIAHVKVKDGNYEMEHDVGLKIAAEGVNAEGMFWVEKGPFGVDISEAHIADGTIHVAGMDLPLSKIDVRKLWISDQEVSTGFMTGFYEKAKLTGQGTVFIGKDYYAIKATLDAPENTYPRGLKPLPFVMPAFSAQVAMAGTLVEPEIDVEAALKQTEFNGLSIHSGTIKAHINQHQITFDSSTLHVGDGGKIFADGIVDVDKKKFSFSTQQKNLSSADLTGFLSLSQRSLGKIEAQTKLEGDLAQGYAPMRFVTQGVVRDGAFDRAQFAQTTNFKADFILDLSKQINFKDIYIYDQQGLSIKGKGNLLLSMKDGDFSYDISCETPKKYFSSWLPERLDGKQIALQGNLFWQSNKLNGAGRVSAGLIDYFDLQIKNNSADFSIADNNISLNKIQADILDGHASGKAQIALSKDININAKIAIDTIDISRLPAKIINNKIGGKASGDITLSGPLKQLRADFSIEALEAGFDTIQMQTLNLNGNYFNNRIELKELFSSIGTGFIEGKHLFYDMTNKEIVGSVFVTDISLSQLFGNYVKIEGLISGPIDIGGTFSSPMIAATLKAKHISVMGQKLGGGPVQIELRREKLIDSGMDEDIVLSLSSTLLEQASKSSLRFGMALNRKTINSNLSFSDFSLNTSELGLKDIPVGIEGKLFANISAYGPLSEPKFDGHLVLSDYGFFNLKQTNNHVILNKKFGPATVNASLNKGQFQLELCAPWTLESSQENCNFQKGISMFLAGPLNPKDFMLDLDAVVRYDHLEEIIPALNDELASLSTDTHIKGKIIKNGDSPLLYNVKFINNAMAISLPNIPQILLQHPMTLAISNQDLHIEDEAVFLFSPGQMKLRGGLRQGKLDVHVNGAIPLTLSKFFVPMIQRGDGLALGELAISGSLEAPIFSGTCAPEKGAQLSFKKLIETVEFKEGSVSFTKTSPHSFITQFDHFKLAVGDGWLNVNGAVNKQYETNLNNELSNFDIAIDGSNIVLRDKNDFVETDFKLSTVKSGNDSLVLSGKAFVIDGSAYRQFDLRNFVIQATQNNDSNMGKMFDKIDLQLSLEIIVRQFRASMRMLNIDVETLLAGQLKVNGPINHPKFTGGLSVSEGAVHFPAATFDLVESRIELDELTERSFDPKILISSSQDFEKDYYPEISQDTTVELSLKGNLDRLNLELKPISGDTRLSQSRIFLMLLMPRGLGASGSEQYGLIPDNAKNAAVAVTGEVFLRPLTNELQELLEGTTKTRIQFGSTLEPGGVTLRLNWKLGPRIELMGSYMFVTDEQRILGEDKISLFGNYPFRDLKLKLLLFDHRPLGPLFLESSFGANYFENELEPRGKIRLGYRIISR